MSEGCNTLKSTITIQSAANLLSESMNGTV